jgi:hypothetical protein
MIGTVGDPVKGRSGSDELPWTADAEGIGTGVTPLSGVGSALGSFFGGGGGALGGLAGGGGGGVGGVGTGSGAGAGGGPVPEWPGS